MTTKLSSVDVVDHKKNKVGERMKHTCYDCSWRYSCVDHCNGCERNKCEFDELGRCQEMDKKEECTQHRAWRICRDTIRKRDAKIKELDQTIEDLKAEVKRLDYELFDYQLHNPPLVNPWDT